MSRGIWVIRRIGYKPRKWVGGVDGLDGEGWGEYTFVFTCIGWPRYWCRCRCCGSVSGFFVVSWCEYVMLFMTASLLLRARFI